VAAWKEVLKRSADTDHRVAMSVAREGLQIVDVLRASVELLTVVVELIAAESLSSK
jgi:hypothetical protein